MTRSQFDAWLNTSKGVLTDAGKLQDVFEKKYNEAQVTDKEYAKYYNENYWKRCENN